MSELKTSRVPTDHKSTALAALATEQSNPKSAELDTFSTLEIVKLMNEEDARVAAAVHRVLPKVALLVDGMVARMRDGGGRLFYVGAGTSGRLGALDAVECPPTFSVSPELVQFIMAGGPGAWQKAVEGAEDDELAGRLSIPRYKVKPADTVVGIAASGRTPFVKGALHTARSLGCLTAAVANQPESEIGALAEIAIEVPVGPEVLTGSTRLKAGTAQKMILNMISTAAMVRLGKTYGNQMVDVMATNEKLRFRARRIVSRLADVPEDTAEQSLTAARGSAKTAILMVRRHCSFDEATALLQESQGSLRLAMERA